MMYLNCFDICGFMVVNICAAANPGQVSVEKEIFNLTENYLVK